MHRLLIILIMAGSAFADFRWSHEPIFKNIDASACHFVGSAYLASSLEHVGLKWWQSDLIAVGLGLGWEIKDGLVPYEKYGWLGGEGFSFGDLTCNICGVVSNRAFQAVLKKVKADKRKRHTLRYDWSKEKFKCGD
jgi:hypothetical protein